MATIEAEETIPRLAMPLEDAEGNSHVIDDAVAAGPIVLGIYKSSCQASKTMFPFLERLHQRYRDRGLTVLGVAQDSANVTRSFARRSGATFPILIEPDDFPVSVAFDIFATPTIFVIRPDRTVAFTTMGFFRDPVNDLGRSVAALLDAPSEELFTAEDTDVPVFVPG